MKYFWFNLLRFNFQFSINLWSHDRKFDVYIKLYSIYSASFWKYECLNVINVYGIKPRICLLYISIEERGGVKQHPVYPSLSRLHGITLVSCDDPQHLKYNLNVTFAVKMIKLAGNSCLFLLWRGSHIIGFIFDSGHVSNCKYLVSRQKNNKKTSIILAFSKQCMGFVA